MVQRCPSSREERDRLIVELYMNGVKIDEIERRACTSRSVIYRVLRSAGIEPRRMSERMVPRDIADAVVKEYLDGRPVAEIASKYGISVAEVYVLLRRQGLNPNRHGPKPRRRLTREEEDEIVRLRAMGLSIYQIASIVGRSPSTVYMVILRRCGGIICNDSAVRQEDGRDEASRVPRLRV